MKLRQKLISKTIDSNLWILEKIDFGGLKEIQSLPNKSKNLIKLHKLGGRLTETLFIHPISYYSNSTCSEEEALSFISDAILSLKWKNIIIRSSSNFEDSYHETSAGIYDSVIVEDCRKETIKNGLESVRKSIKRKTAVEYRKRFEQYNEVGMSFIIQPYLRGDTVGHLCITSDLLNPKIEIECLNLKLKTEVIFNYRLKEDLSDIKQVFSNYKLLQKLDKLRRLKGNVDYLIEFVKQGNQTYLVQLRHLESKKNLPFNIDVLTEVTWLQEGEHFPYPLSPFIANQYLQIFKKESKLFDDIKIINGFLYYTNLFEKDYQNRVFETTELVEEESILENDLTKKMIDNALLFRRNHEFESLSESLDYFVKAHQTWKVFMTKVYWREMKRYKLTKHKLSEHISRVYGDTRNEILLILLIGFRDENKKRDQLVTSSGFNKDSQQTLLESRYRYFAEHHADPIYKTFAEIKDPYEIANEVTSSKNEFSSDINLDKLEKSRIIFENNIMSSLDIEEKQIFKKNLAICRREHQDIENDDLLMAIVVGGLRYAMLSVNEYLLKKGILKKLDDIFYLTHKEICEAHTSECKIHKLSYTLEKRKRAYLDSRRVIPPRKIENGKPQFDYVESATTITGLGNDCGMSKGNCRVINSPEDFRKVSSGDIVVCKTLVPAYSYILKFAFGLVCEFGGKWSHAALISKEYGVPAVFSVPYATQRLSNNTKINLNSRDGTITMQ